MSIHSRIFAVSTILILVIVATVASRTAVDLGDGAFAEDEEVTGTMMMTTSMMMTTMRTMTESHPMTNSQGQTLHFAG